MRALFQCIIGVFGRCLSPLLSFSPFSLTAVHLGVLVDFLAKKKKKEKVNKNNDVPLKIKPKTPTKLWLPDHKRRK